MPFGPKNLVSASSQFAAMRVMGKRTILGKVAA